MTGGTAGRRVLAHCNAGHEYGLGHLMRTLAVIEEAMARGWQARIVGDLDDAAADRATRLVPGVTLQRVPLAQVPGALDDQVEGWWPHVLHLDSYWLDAAAVPRGEHLLSNVQDSPFGVRATDLLVDPNLDAELRITRPSLGRHHLLGSEAAILRSQVRRRAAAPADLDRVRRILVVLGGTDPFGLTARIVAALLTLDGDLQLTVVTPPAQRPELEALAAGSRVELVDQVDDLPGLAAVHDLVVSAAGTSVWDFAHMGVRQAIVAVTENQRAGYLAAVAAGIAHGLGLPPHDDLADRISALGGLLADPAELTLAAARGGDLIDGLGTWRIVAAWEQLLQTGPGPEPAGPELAVRPATMADAGELLAWRNDPATRANSRSTGAIPLEDHVAWLRRVLVDPARQLFVLEEGSQPVACVRWDKVDDRTWEVSITLAPQARGRGLARSVLTAAEAALPVAGPTRLLASVHRDNLPSLRLFARCGYLPHLPADAAGFLSFAKWRLPERSG